MFTELIFFIVGFIFLVKGAEVLVDGSTVIARRFGLSSFFIGLTIVAFGTSLPELIVSVVASIEGSNGIALGNIIGSNISNTLLILGVSAFIAPLAVKKATVDKEIPFSLLAIFAVGFLVNDILLENSGPNSLTRIDGLILILFFSIFIFYTFGISKEKEGLIEKTMDGISDDSDKYNNAAAIGMIIVGLAGLYLGGNWIVESGVYFARVFGFSEVFIGLTLVAFGTSLPELVTSAMAARKGKTDIAVGNIIGSNIFNLLWALGVSSLFNPIAFDFYLNIDIVLLIAVTVLLVILIYVGKKNILDRREGIVMVVIYIFYILYLVNRG